MHDKFTSSDPQPDPSTPSWVPFLVYISYIYMKDLLLLPRQKQDKRENQPTLPRISESLSLLSVFQYQPFWKFKRNNCTYPLMIQTFFRFGDLSSNPGPALQIHTPAKKHIPSLFVLPYRMSKSTLVLSFVSVHSLKKWIMKESNIQIF
jgi:hypothetical protein